MHNHYCVSLPLSSCMLSTNVVCGGRTTVAHLIQRLARQHETAAIIELCNTSLSLAQAVSWRMFGKTLEVLA